MAAVVGVVECASNARTTGLFAHMSADTLCYGVHIAREGDAVFPESNPLIKFGTRVWPVRQVGLISITPPIAVAATPAGNGRAGSHCSKIQSSRSRRGSRTWPRRKNGSAG